MKETTVYLPEAANLALEQLACRTGRPQAELIREAIEHYLSHHSQSLPHSIGMGASGKTDLAERDEELLWQAQTKGSVHQDEPAKAEHPWLKFAGMYENNPLFEDVLADIAGDRRELDAEKESEGVDSLQEQTG